MPDLRLDRSDRRVATPFRLAVVGLCVAAAVVSLAVLTWIYPALSWNRDEPVYLWHADVLEHGALTAPGREPVDAFRPWLGGIDEDGRYFSQYTPGWPMALAASDLATGTPAGAVVGGTVLTVLGAIAVAREITRRDRVAVVVGALVLATPAIVIQSGVYLGYLFTLGIGCLALAAGWSGVRTRRRWLLVASGTLLGSIALTRPFDAGVWGLILVLGVGLRHRVPALRRLWPTVLAGLPFAVLALAYNLRITGSATTFPIVAADPLDTYGFGIRRLAPGFEPVDYGLVQALRSTAKNGLFALLFLAGNLVTVGLATWGVWRRRRAAETWILVAMGLAFPLGYFFFWGTYLSSLTARLVGSIYFLPTVVPLCTLGVLGALEIGRRRLLTGLVVVGLVATAPVLADRLAVNRHISQSQQPWERSVAEVDRPSLVIVAESGPYLFFKNPDGRNEPDREDGVLYALDLGEQNFETIRAHADRTPYLQVASAGAEELIPNEEPITPTVTVVPIELARGRSLRLEATFLPRDGDSVIAPFIEVAGRTVQGSTTAVTAHEDGSVSATFDFAVDADQPGVQEVPVGASMVRVGFGAGADADAARSHPWIRWQIAVEVADDGLIALLPAQQFVRYEVGEGVDAVEKWYPRPAYPGAALSASVSP